MKSYVMNRAAARPAMAEADPHRADNAASLRLAGIERRFRQGDAWLEVLRGVELVLAPGQVMALVGPSGSGTQIRREHLGFVYQFHHLLPEFSALENVMLPQMLAGADDASAQARARDLLRALGLAEREDHRPARLSGGEQQRVAIARAMANRPAVLLADEPTGNLDEETARAVFVALAAVARETAAALLIATHNAELAQRADGIYRLHNGLVETR
jgi:lipoprotein-releasing system ATP-binding protein